MNEVLKTIAAKYKDDIVHTASELIQRNSQSLHEGEVAAYVQEKMKELGYDKVEVDRYGNVFGTMKGTGGGSSVMLNCHMDVVYEGDESLWPYPPYSGAIAEGRVWGRGASDTKGTMAIQIYVPFLLKEAGLLPKGDIITAAVISEEIAGYGAMVHTQENRMLTDYAIVGEATENDIAIGSRGRCCGVITITGKSCHASIPHVGHNPFDFLAQLLPELQKVPMGSDGLFGSSTMSCTRITSSEEGTNIIPNEIVLYVDYRQSGDDTPEEVQRKLEAAIANCHVDGVTAKAELLYFPLTTYTGVEGRGYQGENPFVASADADYIQKVKAAIEDAYYQVVGFTAADVDEIAMSVSLINIKAYGIVIAKPAEGCADTVKAGLQAFIDNQCASFETYLADQYEIAKNAKLETLDDGTIVMVMCANADAVYDAIVASLAA